MSHHTSGRPAADEYAPYYDTYVAKVTEDDVVAALDRQLDEAVPFLGAISEEQAGSAYAPGKWTLKEVLGHVNDGERVFAYRALTFARNDSNALPGFEQDDYVAAARFNATPWRDLVDEFTHLRRANSLLFHHLAPDAWDRRGVASGYEITVRALAYILVGHARHHFGVMRTKYLGG